MGEHYNILTVLVALEKQVRSKELMNIKERRKSLLLDGEVTITQRTKSALCLHSTCYYNTIDDKMITPNNEATENEGISRQITGKTTEDTSKQTETDVIKRKTTSGLNKHNNEETEKEDVSGKITGKTTENVSKQTETDAKTIKTTGDFNKQSETETTKRKPTMEVKPRNISPFSKTERAKGSSNLNQTEDTKLKQVRPKTTYVSSPVKLLDRNNHSPKKINANGAPKQEGNKRNIVKYSCKDAEKIYLRNSGSLRYSHYFDIKKPVKWSMLRRLTNYGLDSVDLVSAANKPENLKLPSLICCPPLAKTSNRNADKTSQFRSKSKGN